MHNEQLVQLCHQHINKYVVLQTTDGQQIDGIIESLDQNNVYVIVPMESGMNQAPVAAMPNMMAQEAAVGANSLNMPHPQMREEDRAFIGGLWGAPGYGVPGYGVPGYGVPGYGYPGYGYPGYGYPGYGYGIPRRRLGRIALPLAALLALTAIPYL